MNLNYKTFEFFSNPQFISYFENIFPTPSKERLEIIKQKWYKKNIDPDFEIITEQQNQPSNYFDKKNEEEEKKAFFDAAKNDQKFENISSNANYSNSTNFSNNVNNTSTTAPQIPFLKNALFTLEAYLKFSFLVSYFGFKILANYLGISISILALLRQGKTPQFTKEYAAKIIFSEHFHNLFYFALFCFFPDFMNLLYSLPMMIHCWIGLCNFAFVKKGKIYEAFKKHVDRTKEKEAFLIVLKQKFEILLLIWLIFKIFFMEHFSIALMVFYSTYIRMKFHMNENLQKAFSEIDLWIKGYVYAHRCPRFIAKIYENFVKVCSYAVKTK